MSLREATKLHPSGYKGGKIMTTVKCIIKINMKARDNFAFQVNQPKAAISLPISLLIHYCYLWKYRE